MASKATVSFVSLNTSKTFKNGKTFDGDEISFTTENGAKKKEFVFANAPYRKEVQKCSAGDVIEVSYTKNGDFFNLSDVKWIEKGNGTTAPQSTGQAGGSTKSFGGYQEAPEKQASIQRQNALTNATSLIVAALEQGTYKKTTSPDILIGEVLRVADKFTAFNAGTLQLETIKANTTAVVPEDHDVPFDMGNDELDI